MSEKSSICVFCGAQNAVPQTHLDNGKAFGQALAKHNMRLVYGGGDSGIMGAVANAVLAESGAVTGVFPEGLQSFESEHKSLTEILIVGSMHERKMLMFERSDAFVVLPGGFGTMDEMFEIITWKQLRIHAKPVIIFNYQGYWDPLVKLMDNMLATGFARPETASFYSVVTTLEGVFQALEVQLEKKM